MQQAVGKRRLPMVNVGDDAEISYMRCVHCLKSERGRITGKRVKKRKFGCRCAERAHLSFLQGWMKRGERAAASGRYARTFPNTSRLRRLPDCRTVRAV
jgi:hypothetical protein